MWDKGPETILFIVYTQGTPDSVHSLVQIFIFALGIGFRSLAQLRINENRSPCHTAGGEQMVAGDQSTHVAY